MDNKTIPITILFLAIIGLSIFGLSRSDEANKPGENTGGTEDIDISSMGITYFYGIGCPYCDVVDEYITDNNVMDVINFEKKEVYNNRENANQLTKIAEYCKLDPNFIGVPFMWTGDTCLIGDKDIISFLANETNAE